MIFSMKHFGSLVSFGFAIFCAGWLVPAGAQQALEKFFKEVQVERMALMR